MKSGSASAAAASAAAARTAAAGGRSADIAAALAAAGAAGAGRGRAAHRAAGAGGAVEAEAAFAVRAVAVAADGAVRLAAGIAAGLADEAREGDAAPKAGITHKDVPPKKMSRDPDPMTSYEARRNFVRDSVARCVSAGKAYLTAGDASAHRRHLRVAQLVRDIVFFLLQNITPAIACIAGTKIIPVSARQARKSVR